MARTPSALWQQLLIACVATVGLAQLGYAFVTTTSAEHWLRSVCAAWDRDARTSIASASDVGVLGRHLERAREYCSAGCLCLARQDYQVLHTAHATAAPGDSFSLPRSAPT